MQTRFNLSRLAFLQRIPGRWQRTAAAAALLLALWAGYIWTGQAVTVVIGEQTYTVRTHRLTVEAVLWTLNLPLEPEDQVQPPPGVSLKPGQQVAIRLARPVVIDADGRTVQQLTQQQTVAGVLAQAGIPVNTHDEVLVEGVPVSLQATLPPGNDAPGSAQAAAAGLFSQTPRGAVAALRPQPVHLLVHRAVPVTLHDGRVSSTFYTTRPTVGEALLEQGLTLYLADKVLPGLGMRVTPGMNIYIQRSAPVTIVADGRTIKTRTRRRTVEAVLAQEDIALMGQDFSRPAAHQPVTGGQFIQVVRVRETFEIGQEIIPFETNWVPDTDMPLDQQELRQQGKNGVIKSRTRVRFENGQEVWRGLEDEWLDQEPVNRIIAYGTKITVQTLQTEDGPIEYWRKISMLATPYSAATSGKAPDHPRYGITRSGLPAGYGIVAVDPKVIPLMTNLYVPGYGRALAADTGGLILGKRIDLGYDEDQPMPDFYEWRDVYVLTPVPPPDKIRYVLPNWPQP